MSLLEKFEELNKKVQKPRYKEVGNWMVRNIIREASVPMTYLLLKTPVTANQVTVFSLVLALLGCFIFLSTNGLTFLVLAVFLHLSYYFDHVDGQIARYKSQVSITGVVLDILSHFVIYGALTVSIGLKAYYESGEILYVYYGIIASLSLISFNLLQDSKYRAFFIELLKCKEIRVRTEEGYKDSFINRSLLHRAFSLVHKTCEIHVMINTITVFALLQLLGLRYLILPAGNYTWAQVLAFYYAVSCLVLAVAKTTFIVITKKPDKEFEDTFLVD